MTNKTPNESPLPGWIRAGAILQSIYAAIEILDCITACMMAFDILPNLYPKMVFSEFQYLFDQQPAWLIPLFLFYTSLRACSAYGLWKNRLWGFWMTLFVTIATLMMAPFLIPITTVEMLMNAGLVILLLIGYFRDTPIHPNNTEVTP